MFAEYIYNGKIYKTNLFFIMIFIITRHNTNMRKIIIFDIFPRKSEVIVEIKTAGLLVLI